MNKEEMTKKLALYDGVGVEVTDAKGTYYYFYENFNGNDDGISRVYKHFTHGEKLTFYSRKWARQTLFKSYMKKYENLVEEANKSEKEYINNPYSEEIEEQFRETHHKQIEYLMYMCRRLMDWAKTDFYSAKKQIITNSVHYSYITD